MSSSTLAGDVHFVDGYHVIYDSVGADDSIELLVAQFATSRDAKNFQASFVPSDTAISADYPAIPGADVFNSTGANPGGGFDHGFIATKGTRTMIIDDLTGNAAPVPDIATLAQAQYAKL
jgi:hypothetical protein